MNIGIDLDGVLYDTENWFRVESCFYNEKIGGGEMIAPEEVKAYKRYNWTKEQENEFLKECLLEIENNAPMMYKAKEVLDRLVEDGHKIFVITSRGLVFSEELEITKKRLEKDNIKYEKLIFSTSDKGSVCKNLNVDVMIEDYKDYVLNIAESGIKCFFYRGNILTQINHPNVTEVRNWGDIYFEIKKLIK